MALVDVYARRDENGNPSLGNAVLVVGDGTVKVEFRQGHARVSEEIAKVISVRADLDIPNLQGTPAPPGLPNRGPFPDMEVVQGVDAPPVESKTQLRSPASDEAVRLAKEHLEAEGEGVPQEEEVPPVLPSGFELRLPDGSLRCTARKADGRQCKNQATARYACGLQAHQDQVVRQGAQSA